MDKLNISKMQEVSWTISPAALNTLTTSAIYVKQMNATLLNLNDILLSVIKPEDIT